MSKTTEELTNELAEREGVKQLSIKPYEEAKLGIGEKEISIVGPAVILINQD
ncbi:MULTISPECIES: BC1881 family protein [Fructobacillus]|uniref:BC1881 family protein n=1 Tax=Fructobacillus fructosus TaxID=1631 RepID=A0ABM9MZA8_9LACO|nr:BC1881 family protein [Fructobacillus parabroussonetiae]MCK8618023.1 BC1881 family protein [Fructobacillus parabroussonetiae]CAK1246754.1 unnamed protein product [Fructobacillus fructosus]CAK1250799.1 unnamed protein product [Fructobacillus fructosus]